MRLFSPIDATQAPADSTQQMPAGKRARLPETTSRPAANQIKILLVDDHPIFRKAIACILQDARDIAVVAEVAGGKAAIEAARSLKPDAILMDVNMPEMNGVKATRAIMEEGLGVKIIGLSMHDDHATRQAMLEAGACAYLVKGGPVETLIDTIRRCIDPT